MRTRWLGLSTALALACFVNVALSAPFEPLVVAGVSTGGCSVLSPNATAPVPAKPGKAYPFGTTFTTAPGTGIPLILGIDNECLLGGSAQVRTSEDAGNKTRKMFTLVNGKLEVTLNPEYSEYNTFDVASECVRASFTKGGKASFESMSEGDLAVFVITCGDALLSVTGPQFTISQLKKDDVLSAACAPDLSYIRIRDVKGTYVVNIRDAEGQPKEVPMEPGSVVKILQKRSEVENTVVVTLLIVGTDESVKEAITYSVALDQSPAAPQPEAASTKSGGQQPEAAQPTETPAETVEKGDGQEWEPMWPSPPPAPTTTTTTVPPDDVLAADAYRRSLGAPPAVPPLPRRTTTTTTQPLPTPVGKR